MHLQRNTFSGFLPRTQVLRALTLLLLGVLLAVAVGHLIARLAYELQGPFNFDSPIYWAVGRGIVNGLTPYADLFETKPPGIFLVSALSFYIFDDVTLTHVLQSMVFLSFPIIVVGTAWFMLRDLPRYRRVMGLGVTALYACVVTLYIANRSGEVQVESFGALFGTFYACILALRPTTLTRRLRLALAGMILLSIGFKEPFLLTCLALALLQYSSDDRLFERLGTAFFRPAAVACVVGAFLLLMMGYLVPYLTVYLPEMLGNHITEYGPLWQRALDVPLLFVDLLHYNRALALVVLGLFIVQVLSVYDRARPLVLVLQHFFFTLVAVYSLSVTVAAGGQYYDHHFVFAAPALFTFYLTALRLYATNALPAHLARTATAALLLGLLYTTLGLRNEHYSDRLYWAHKDEAEMRTIARNIDAIIDECDLDSYMFIGQNGIQPFSYTRHSPVGPLFLQYNSWMNKYRPAFQQSTMNNLFEAKLVVLQNFELAEYTNQANAYLHSHFSAYPWSCAKQYNRPGPFTFFYRNTSKGVAVRKKDKEVHGAAPALPGQPE